MVFLKDKLKRLKKKKKTLQNFLKDTERNNIKFSLKGNSKKRWKLAVEGREGTKLSEDRHHWFTGLLRAW